MAFSTLRKFISNSLNCLTINTKKKEMKKEENKQ